MRFQLIVTVPEGAEPSKLFREGVYGKAIHVSITVHRFGCATREQIIVWVND